jgi:chromosome segregation ATPase
MSCSNPTKLSQMGSTKNNMDKLNDLADQHCTIMKLADCNVCCRIEDNETAIEVIHLKIRVIESCISQINKKLGIVMNKDVQEQQELDQISSSDKTLADELTELHSKIDTQQTKTDNALSAQQSLISGLNSGNSNYVTNGQLQSALLNIGQQYATAGALGTVQNSIDTIKSQMTQIQTQQACISSTCNT